MKLLTVQSPNATISRIWLNFKEVTNETFQAEVADKPNRFSFGTVGMYAKDENDQLIVDSDGFGRRVIRKIEYRKGLIFWALKKQSKH